LELESWFGSEKPQGAASLWDWWFGPVAGLTDRLEAGLFAIFAQAPAGSGTPGAIGLTGLRLQLTYLLVDRGAWPVDVRIRGEVFQPLPGRFYSTWLSVIASRDFGPLNITGNVIGWLQYETDHAAKYTDFGVGSSYNVGFGLRVGGEFFGRKEWGGDEEKWAVGPSVGYGRGRFWLAGSFGFGVGSNSPQHQGRVVVGLAL
jgi:hypothetical protein